MRTPTRREALKQLGAAGAGILAAPALIGGQDTGIVVAGQLVDVAISSVNPDCVRITIRRATGGSDASLADGALAKSEWGAPLARTRAGTQATVRAGNISVALFPPRPQPDETRALSIHVQEAMGRRTSYDTTATLIWKILEIDRDTGRVSFSTEGSPVLGLGQGGPQFDRRGSTFTNRSGQGAYQLRTHGGRVPIQWIIQGHSGLYIHQPLGTVDLTGPVGYFDPPANAPLPLDIFVVGSNDPAVVMKAWADITGYAEMPPLWSLGYMQSHRTLGGPDEIMSVARTFREKQLPCDALIYLGTDFCPAGWNTHNGEFTWKPETFPDPKRMIDDLHAQHFKTVLHIVVEAQTLTGTVSDPCTAEPLPPGRTPDGRWPPNRQVSCYWPAHKPLFDLGIDGWWPDQGDGLDAPSRLARNRMYWDGSLLYRPNERVFALHRNGYAGMQRIAAFLWSGDIYSFWETLKNHVPIAINTALSGIPYWGTDIGGFVPTADYTGELHVRWFQFGTFTTLFRAHGRTWHLRLPWGWNTGDVGVSEVAGYTGGAQDPPASELHNAGVEPIVKKYLELRYRLMPYLYSAVRECSQSGMPIVRAMWLHYPDDPAATSRGDQYLWGRDVLVAPVVEKGATSRRLYLPKGAWFDFWTNERLDGGREIDRPVDLATMPLYVRAGAVIPMGPVKQHVDEPRSEPLTMTVYPGADGASSLYEDDGKTFDYRKGAWMGISMKWRDADRRLTLDLSPRSRMLPPLRRPIDVRIAGTQTVRSVVFEGKTVEVRL
jgi:alpha-glucosidase/alpha-D-xyloside xylohydrolase